MFSLLRDKHFNLITVRKHLNVLEEKKYGVPRKATSIHLLNIWNEAFQHSVTPKYPPTFSV